MLTLELFEETYLQAFELLGEYQQAYDNDGTLPDGSTLLPKRPLPDHLIKDTVDAGFGRLIDVSHWSDAEIRGYLQDSELFDGDLPFSDEGLLEGFSSEKTCAHYGVIGTETSLWIVSDASPYVPITPEGRLQLWQLGMQFGLDVSQAELPDE